MQSPTVTTTYYIRDSIDATGCSDSKQIIINVNPRPSILARDTTICAGELINLSTLIQGATAMNNLEYGTALGTYTLSNGIQAPTVTTTYYIRDSLNAPSCLDTTQLTVTVKPATVMAMAGNDQLNICGTTVNISANMPSVGTGTWSATPSAGSFGNVNQANTTFTGHFGAVYTLTWTITGECGNESDQIIVQFNPDSDNDTVQDCNDICPNGDDRVNTDGMGMPDACDCSPNDINDEEVEVIGSFGGYIVSGTYQASFEITSNSRVRNGSLVQFKAGNAIVLEPGFHSEAGSEFMAKIELCNNASLLDKSLINRELTGLTDFNKIGKGENKFDWQISPNPFSDALKVKATFSKDESIISLSIHDHLGRLVTSIIKNQAFSEGTYEWLIDGKTIPTGINYLLIQTSEGPSVKKLIKVR
jgi:hypothetical protein